MSIHGVKPWPSDPGMKAGFEELCSLNTSLDSLRSWVVMMLPLIMERWGFLPKIYIFFLVYPYCLFTELLMNRDHFIEIMR
jgi:hypothetical protein